MNRLMLTLCCLSSASALALAPAAPMTPSETPMKQSAEEKAAKKEKHHQCAGEAKEKGLKGPEKKAFLKECMAPLLGEQKAAKKEKRAGCKDEAKAKGLKGAEKKEFMKSCVDG